MAPGNPLRGIAYPAGLRAAAILPAALLWALLCYALAGLPLLYFLAIRPSQSPFLPYAWSHAGRPELYVAVDALLFLALLAVGFGLLRNHLEDDREREAETLGTLLGFGDGTGTGGWDAWLVIALPVAGIALACFGLVGPVELPLFLGVPLAVVLGSRRLPRFPEAVEEPLRGYSDDRIAELLKTGEGEGVSLQQYRWRFREHPYVPQTAETEFRFSIPFHRAHYEEALEKPHQVTTETDYAGFVREDMTTEEVVLVAAQLKKAHAEKGFTRFQQVGNVLAFMRQFDYATDQETRGIAEYPRYPVETLWDRKGDCECHAILAAALLALLGFDVVLLVVDFARGPGHLAVGIAGTEGMPDDLKFYELDGRRYFYCEATPPTLAPGEPRHWDWKIGELPFDDPARVTPVPIVMAVAA